MSKYKSDNLSPLWRLYKEASLHDRCVLILSTWFGSGLLPGAPGTFGTLAALPLVLALSGLGIGFKAFFLLILTGISIWAAHRSQGLIGKPDPREVVIDEVVGFFLTMTFIPFSWWGLGLGFALFRLFDILKPFPVKKAETLKGGLGIVADDIVAGLYGGICLKVVFLLS
ncbi:MAG: phosphatidylglycerophosphatase A [Desulfatiglans sp.]|jgi:phosphatidylglycerophosphatase A|nr:phosphatidylglycerophosphatase A [Thermodesulfobacteriota bacterium]MEE4352610.1 phosphatidylglycerophosphatase A [Desulfatiglans sp.]